MPATPAPPAPPEARCRFAIVGAGIAGAALAWQLAQAGRGDEVLLLEREDLPGRHSTGRSAATFMENYGPAQVRALTRASRAFYEAPPQGFLGEGQQILSPRGELYVAAPGQEAMLEALHETLAASSPTLRRIEAAEAIARVPVLRAEATVAALLDPGGCDIDVQALHQGYLRGLRRAGGRLWCEAELVAAERLAAPAAGSSASAAPAGWRLHLADGRQVVAEVIVNAAGAWADAVAGRCGLPGVGLQPRRRSAFTFDLPPGIDARGWPAVVGVTEDWYFKPDAGRLLGSPANADDTHPHDVVPEELDIALGIHRIEAATTLQIRRPASTWAGLRSFVADGELVIGPDPLAPGFCWLAAQGGYGIQSAQGAALLAASLIRGEPLPEALRAQGVDAAALSPARLRAKAPPV